MKTSHAKRRKKDVIFSPYQYCPFDGERLVIPVAGEVPRPKCPKCGFVDYQNPKACVAILITNGKNILLARRRVEPAKGEWDIPGGFVDPGESGEEAVVREAFEETTLRVRITDFLGSVPDVYGPRATPTLNLCFLVEILRGVPQPKSDVESLTWFALNSLPKRMAFAHQKKVFNLLKRSNTTRSLK